MPKENHKDTQPLIQAELESYSALLTDIRALIKQAQGRAYQAVDNIRVQTYWQIGELGLVSICLACLGDRREACSLPFA
ncbi:MAG: hypothetical protein HY756_06095 [Nitrospirae bacterium]|nr:hypothetical protein [Nitrospirota bacterium]